MNNITVNKAIVLRELENGPAKWSVLRRAYFGEGRAAEAASTSFYNKINGLIKEGLIVRSVNGYEITGTGKEALATARKMFDVTNAKSQARLKWEAEHPVASTATVATVEVPA